MTNENLLDAALANTSQAAPPAATIGDNKPPAAWQDVAAQARKDAEASESLGIRSVGGWAYAAFLLLTDWQEKGTAKLATVIGDSEKASNELRNAVRDTFHPQPTASDDAEKNEKAIARFRSGRTAFEANVWPLLVSILLVRQQYGDDAVKWSDPTKAVGFWRWRSDALASLATGKPVQVSPSVAPAYVDMNEDRKLKTVSVIERVNGEDVPVTYPIGWRFASAGIVRVVRGRNFRTWFAVKGGTPSTQNANDKPELPSASPVDTFEQACSVVQAWAERGINASRESLTETEGKLLADMLASLRAFKPAALAIAFAVNADDKSKSKGKGKAA